MTTRMGHPAPTLPRVEPETQGLLQRMQAARSREAHEVSRDPLYETDRYRLVVPFARSPKVLGSGRDEAPADT